MAVDKSGLCVCINIIFSFSTCFFKSSLSAKLSVVSAEAISGSIPRKPLSISSPRRAGSRRGFPSPNGRRARGRQTGNSVCRRTAKPSLLIRKGSSTRPPSRAGRSNSSPRMEGWCPHIRRTARRLPI